MIKKSQSNSFIWASMERASLLIFQFFAIVYLSRSVSPYDFGLIAIVNLFILISNIFIDSGMMGALIKKGNVQDVDFHTFFIFNVTASAVIYIIIFFLSPSIATLYEIPQLDNIIKILSLTIIFNAFSLVQIVILTKKHNFKLQFIVTFISQIIAVTIAISLAKHGYGVWSLISLQLLHSIFNVVLLTLVTRYCPAFIFSKKSFLALFKFGWPLLASNILYVINFNIYNSLIGKIFTPVDAGYFYQAQKLQQTPIGILTAIIDKVGFTILSQHEKKELKYHSHNLYQVIYLIITPLLVYITYASNDIFMLIFTSDWIIASHIFSILCLNLIPLLIRLLNRNSLKSLGKTKIILKIEIITSALIIASIIYTSSFDVMVMAYGVLFVNIIITIISIYYIRQELAYSYYKQISIIIRPLLYSIPALTLALLPQYFWHLNIFTDFDIITLINYLVLLAIYYYYYFIYKARS